MDEYFLPTHVHCCRRGDAYVFLDLKQDDYMLIAGPAADALSKLTERGSDPSTTQTSDPLRELEEGKLLTKDRSMGRVFATTEVELAIEPLLEFDEELPTVRSIDLWNFTAACTTAAARLRWRPLEETVATVAQRKAAHGAHDRVDLDRARHLTAVFNRLRRLFPANYLCLFDSLALVEFLARYQLYPNWIFGVRLEPWAAHCWIQQGGFAFNENVEQAASYTPIMAV
jgi:hypothetical protein